MRIVGFFRQCLIAALGGVIPAATVSAQPFPDHPVKLVVPFAAGGGVDILTRVLSEKMGQDLGQPMMVENRVGAGGNLGSDYVAKSKPDGYTLLVATTGTHAINPVLFPKLPFDAKRDFIPISLIAAVPNLLVVGPRLQVKSLQELIEFAKRSPGKLSYASFGNGTSNHLSGELLKMQAGIDVVHIPYKSATQAVTDLLGGQIDFAFVNMPLALAHVQSGKLNALAITSAERNASVADVPTMSQAGLNDFVVESWYGLMAPKGTSLKTIDVLQKATAQALLDQKVRDSFAKNGAEVRSDAGDAFDSLISSERARWTEVIERAKVNVD
ncbi:Bug family tripartite tricarboxylate transporter substrate binding protein [Zwartia panacis]|uniref:Bug family tripartite tricarboxylate transporter substrate binding protein n=1 Tax=Zwartia panacis TaxID=2683345 RepID=UPI0025B2E293|nr:tripartite tricarboxylate transporter substrate binding protein [Zwartia panacis]MDN4016479.1 tripartite tricarboxylate transporter substrate binding protein [Zwartia panacis]